MLYRPACVVRMQIRLEDFGTDVDDDVATEALPFEQQLKRLVAAEARTLKAVSQSQASNDRVGAGQHRKELRNIRDQIARLRSQDAKARASTEQAGDLYSIEFSTVPHEASVELNSYRALDSAKITIPFRDAPLESEDIRSALIEIYMGVVPAEDFTTPSRWKLTLDRRNLLFRGYVEDWETSHTEEDAVVEVPARSMECVLHDAKVDPRSKIFRVPPGGETISQYINRVMANVPATSGRTGGDQFKAIFYRATDEPRIDGKLLARALQTVKSRNAAAPGAGGVLPAADTGSTPAANAAPTAEMRVPPPQATDISAWDLIVQACEMVGCLPIYDPSLEARDFTHVAPLDGTSTQALAADFLLIRPATTIYETVSQGVKVTGGSPDKFERLLPAVNATTNQLVPSEIRFLVWGRNITEMKTKRKLGRIKAPQVEVVSYNADAPAGDRVITVRFPTKKVVTRRGAKGEGGTNEVVRKIVYGVRDKEQLLKIANGLYHAIGRNELEVNVETDDPSSYMDPSRPEKENPDVLRLRSGSPCRVVVAHQVTEKDAITLSPLSEIYGRNTDELRKLMLEQQGRFRPERAEASRAAVVEQMLQRIATAKQASRRTDAFYVRNVKHAWSSEDGWSAGICLVNFVEARALAKNISAIDETQDQKQRIQAVPTKTPEFVAATRASKAGIR
jgi:hypothetical protein